MLSFPSTESNVAESGFWNNAGPSWYICVLFRGEDMGWEGGCLPAADRVESLLGRAQVLGSAGNVEAAFQIVVFSILTSSSGPHFMIVYIIVEIWIKCKKSFNWISLWRTLICQFKSDIFFVGENMPFHSTRLLLSYQSSSPQNLKIKLKIRNREHTINVKHLLWPEALGRSRNKKS